MVTFAGLFIGTFFSWILSDHYGRRFIFTYSLLWHRCNRQHSLPDFDRASGWASKSSSTVAYARQDIRFQSGRHVFKMQFVAANRDPVPGTDNSLNSVYIIDDRSDWREVIALNGVLRNI